MEWDLAHIKDWICIYAIVVCSNGWTMNCWNDPCGEKNNKYIKKKNIKQMTDMYI